MPPQSGPIGADPFGALVQSRPVRRHLLNLLTALSLLLSAAVAGLWAVDHGGTTSREIFLAAGHTAYGLFFDGDNFFCGAFGSDGKGGLALSVQTDHCYTRSLYCLAVLMDQGRIWPHLGGFGAAHVDARPGYEVFRRASILMFPWWVAPAVLLPPSAARLAHLVRDARRRKSGRCPSCGYDLCATPDRCPECGTAGG